MFLMPIKVFIKVKRYLIAVVRNASFTTKTVEVGKLTGNYTSNNEFVSGEYVRPYIIAMDLCTI